MVILGHNPGHELGIPEQAIGLGIQDVETLGAAELIGQSDIGK